MTTMMTGKASPGFSAGTKKRKFTHNDSKRGGTYSSGGEEKPSSSSQSSSSNKKRALKHERQSHRRHADAVVTAKEIWNKLRLKTNSREEIESMTTELMNLLQGKLNEVAMQHDASRVVQAIVQFGTDKQRRDVVKELSSSGSGGGGGNKGKHKNNDVLAELAKCQYAHFVVLKMIKYCPRDKECVKLICKSLRGHIPKLAVHSVGARVVELLFSSFPPKSTSMLKRELYGPQFAVFADEGTKLSSHGSHHLTLRFILDQHPTQKVAALEYVLSLLHKGIDKSLFGFAYFQQLLMEYVTSAQPNDVRSLAPSIVDHSIHLLSTRPGTRVVCELAAYGTVKDRKRILKSLKGYCRSSLLHRDAYLAILRVVDVCDDTVAVHKSLLAELRVNPDLDDAKGGGNDDDEVDGEASTKATTSPILDVALSDAGSKLFLTLLAPDDTTRRKYLDPYEVEVLRPNVTVTEQGEEVPTSKKNPDTRRRELVSYLRRLLTELVETHAEELLRSKPGGRVLREVCRTFPSEELASVVVDACQSSVEHFNAGTDDKDGNDGSDDNDDDDDEARPPMPLFEDPVGHLALKNVLLDEVKKTSENESNSQDDDGIDDGGKKDDSSFVAQTLLRNFQGKLMQIASSNRGAFVLMALAKVDSVKEEVVKELKRHKKEIKALAKHGKDGKKTGFEALWNTIQA